MFTGGALLEGDVPFDSAVSKCAIRRSPSARSIRLVVQMIASKLRLTGC